ncbi:unnamed protein product, partial [Prunus brigantina]
MPGISPDVICHKLSISPTCKPVRQKRRSYDTERYEAMRNEVDKLKAIGFIKEATYPIKAIIDMETPRTQKDIQSLTGRVAALTRFISKATDKCVPFFRALKGGKHHVAWTTECDEAFQTLKNYMSKAPLLSKPLPGEVLLLYLSVSVTAVSSVLIRKPEKAELPIFYVSKALQSAELRYPPLEQLALALVISARRLRPYFQAHQITVLTNQPLRQVLQKPETSGRLVKWAIELGEFDIQFKPRPAEKGQAVADFISELTLPASSEPLVTEPTPPVTESVGTEHLDPSVPVWILHVDGSANQQGCGAGLVLTTPDGSKLEYALRFSFRTSNNEAEYEALLAGLRLAKSMSAKQIRIHNASMSAYLSVPHQLLQRFQAYEIRQIPRSENSHADALSRLASAINDKIGRKVPVEILSQPSTTMAEWGLDLIGPMPEGKGQVKYAVVAVDYFTKWVEAKALATITAARVEDFVWTDI